MGGIDATTWQAIGVLLTVLGLVTSVLVWRAKGPASGLRGVAWSLLPLAAGLTGVLKLIWQIGTNIVDWAVRLVFSPVVWAGVAVAGVALMLFAVSAALRAREGTAARRSGAGPGAGRPQLTAERSSPPARGRRTKTAGSAAGSDPELDDIEEILRKHGIS